MRVLFTTQPFLGHFHPLVPLAQALQVAGHEVAFACPRSFSATVEANGFQCFPAGFDGLPSMARNFVHMLGLLPEADRDNWLIANVFAGIAAKRSVPNLLTLGHTWSPDVIVRDPLEFGGWIAAESLGIPHVSSGPPYTLWQGPLPRLASQALIELRRAHGLSSDLDLATLYHYLFLAFLPPAFVRGDEDIPPTAHFLRPVSFNQSGSEALPTWIEQLPRRPTVHASLGTIFNRTPGLNQAIIEALRGERINLILTVGRDQDPAQFGPQPSNVYLERYIPHTLLLPHCDVVITHGGFSSVMACLSQGLPLVVVPLDLDQPANGRRCAALGVALVIEPATRTSEAFREATRDVLQNPTYRQNAERLRDEMQALPGLEYAVALLERLAVEKRPLLASKMHR